jgi:hypothetical protein
LWSRLSSKRSGGTRKEIIKVSTVDPRFPTGSWSWVHESRNAEPCEESKRSKISILINKSGNNRKTLFVDAYIRLGMLLAVPQVSVEVRPMDHIAGIHLTMVEKTASGETIVAHDMEVAIGVAVAVKQLRTVEDGM